MNFNSVEAAYHLLWTVFLVALAIQGWGRLSKSVGKWFFLNLTIFVVCVLIAFWDLWRFFETIQGKG